MKLPGVIGFSLTLAVIITALAVLFPLTAQAQAADYPSGWQILPDCALTDGNCDLDDFVQMFVNLAAVALKVLPYLAMIMMIWGGFNLITSGGNPEKIQSGKKMITSVVLGVLIITVLAWMWSYFIIFLLTGSYNIFPGYSVLEREWWGGGVVEQSDPSKGCCIIQDGGCVEETKESCENREEVNGQETRFMGEGEWCYKHEASCTAFNYGCCVPKSWQPGDPAGACYVPNENGCLDYNNTAHDPNLCVRLADICDPVQIEGQSQYEETDTGCCVKNSPPDFFCQNTTYDDCQTGDFVGDADCSGIEECNSGCCLEQKGCYSGMIDCGKRFGTNASWNPSSCSTPPNDSNCAIGCCQLESTAFPGNVGTCRTNYTQFWCNASVNYLNWTGTGGSCDTVGPCNSGCCTEQCTSGSVDDSCPNTYNTYNPTTSCSALPECDTGCCLRDGATRCTDNIRESDCDSANFWNDSCAVRAECNEGCLLTDATPGPANRCIDNVAAQYEIDNGSLSYWPGTACADRSECDVGGYCIIGGVCESWTSPKTRAECAAAGGVFAEAPAECP